jgi:transcriptional regulator with XRE-family HTH domain
LQGDRAGAPHALKNARTTDPPSYKIPLQIPATEFTNLRAVGEQTRRHFEENTQPVADVIRRRIRTKREAAGLSQAELARKIRAAGLPLSGDKISKIESGKREVSVPELFAFAHVLPVPFIKLLTPLDGEKHVRITEGFAVDHSEVANWTVWGPPWRPAARAAQELMRLTLEIAFWMQAHEDDPSADYMGEVAKRIERLQAAAGIRRGVVRRRGVATTAPLR